MTINPFYKCMGFLASIIGIVQGLVWTTLALIGVLIYTGVWIPESNESTYGHLLSTTIVRRFLRGGHPGTVIVGPLQFFTYCVAYLVASINWTVLSSFKFWVVFRDKPLRLRRAMVAWAGWAIILCIYDLGWASVLAYDYDKVVTEINGKKIPTTKDYVLISAYGVLTTLVAKGFVLWIVNLTVAIYIMKLAFTVPKKVTEDDLKSDTNVIDAFDKTANWNVSKPELTRSNSFISSRSFGTFQGLPRLPPVQSTNETLARISRVVVSRSPSNASPASHNTFLYPDRRSPSTPGYSSVGPKSPQRPIPSLKPALKNRFN